MLGTALSRPPAVPGKRSSQPLWGGCSPRRVAGTPAPSSDGRPEEEKVPGACSQEEAPAGQLGSQLHRPPAPLGVARPTRLPGTRAQPRPRAPSSRPRGGRKAPSARALRAPPRRTQGPERARAPPTVPGSPAGRAPELGAHE